MIKLDFADYEDMFAFAQKVVGATPAGARPMKIGPTNSAAPQPAPAPQPISAPAPSPATPQPVAQPAPVPQPIPVTPTPAAPVMPAPAPVVPTTQKVYTPDDLARAAGTLMESGKQDALIQLLGTFGVSSLPELHPDQYGAFATSLRGMGAQI